MDRTEISTPCPTPVSNCSRPIVPTLSEDTRFGDDLDADSLDLVEVVMSLEDRFGIAIPEDDLEDVETIGQAVDLVQTRLADEATA